MRCLKFLFLLMFIAFLNSCSSLPTYLPYDSAMKIGYTETKLATGAYKVFASLPNNMEKNDRDGYLFLRIAQLCKNDGFDFFHFSPSIQSEDKVENEKKYAITGFCSKEATRLSLNIILADKLNIEEIMDTKSSTLLEGDFVEEINGNLVKTISDLKLVLHSLPINTKKVKLTILRKDKKIETEQILGKTDELLGPNDYKSLRLKFL